MTVRNSKLASAVSGRGAAAIDIAKGDIAFAHSTIDANAVVNKESDIDTIGIRGKENISIDDSIVTAKGSHHAIGTLGEKKHCHYRRFLH